MKGVSSKPPRDPKRIQPMLDTLKRIWTKSPDLRLGQIIVNASGDKPFYIEDDKMFEGLRALEDLYATKDIKYLARMVNGKK